ncbi:uncharacterized protein LOC131436759 [Malaya genurostris]|uniref:uncharacterized protein LOC131436759 n=1 Tax=Malaya genurostris TaxID=325434 RepID=UPI0026F3C008|nr:uncharacterized protein LOC131436759 [Malaya genurostris]
MEYKLEMVTESFEKYRNLRFPLKVWILVNATGENRFLRWDKSKTILRLDRDALEKYLESEESIFRCKKLSTFFWLMDFNGFESVVESSDEIDDDDQSGNKHILLYKHVSFTGENRTYFEQMLRSRHVREVISKQHGNCSVHQGKILKNQKQCEIGGSGEATATTARSQLSSSSFAPEKFNLLMETKSLELSVREAYGNLHTNDDEMIPIIEVPATYCDEPATEVPEYTKQRVIAGNYGRVNLDDLKRFFGDYLPVYDDSPEAQGSTEPDEKPTVTAKQSSPEARSSELVSSSPEAPPKPPPVNTLDTFDYINDPTVEQENFEPVVDPGEFSPLSSMADLSFLNHDDDPILPIGSDGTCHEPLSDETQFRLCAEIRETFELLNQL